MTVRANMEVEAEANFAPRASAHVKARKISLHNDWATNTTSIEIKFYVVKNRILRRTI